METFGEWLTLKIKTEGWSQSELARRCGVSHVAISRIVSGERKPGLALCKSIAHALCLPEVYVLQKAGLIEHQTSQGNEKLDAILEAIKLLDDDDLCIVESVVFSTLQRRRTHNPTRLSQK